MPAIKYKEALSMEVKRGRPAIGKKPSKKELQRLYMKESRSIRDVAEILACSKDMVYRALNEYGIRRKKRIRKGKLTGVTLEFLEKEFRTKTTAQLAKELGVSRQGLNKKIRKLRHMET